MTGKLRPVGMLLGLVGNALIAVALYHLIQTGSCGGQYANPCPASDTPYFLMLPAGIILSVIAAFVGGGAVAFMGTFLAVGIGSLAAGIWGDNEDAKTFALVFGGIFTGVALLMVFGALALRRSGAGKAAKAQQLLQTGAKAVGTVVDVQDTGVTINDNPRVRVVMQIQPQDGSPAFQGEKTVTVSRVSIPRPGDRFPVWYDRSDPTQWMYGSDMDPSVATPDVRAMFAAAQQAQWNAPAPAAAPAPVAAPATDPLSEIARLNELRMQGALTDEEFQKAKDRLLAQLGGGATPAA